MFERAAFGPTSFVQPRINTRVRERRGKAHSKTKVETELTRILGDLRIYDLS